MDNWVNRENLRSEKKIKFNCPFTKVVNIRNRPVYRGVDLWNTLKDRVGPRFELLVRDSQLLTCFSTYMDILYIKLKLTITAIL